jgi:DNA-directed RNA polymerase subunit RPC12/RpoP
MKVLWTKHPFHCCGCGRLAYTATIKEGQDPEKYRPVECGHCGSTRFNPPKENAA